MIRRRGQDHRVNKPKPVALLKTPPIYDDDQAAKEGWGLYECGDRFFIQKIDDLTTFPTDAAAIAFVERKAAAGSGCHVAALERHGKPIKDYLAIKRGRQEDNADET